MASGPERRCLPRSCRVRSNSESLDGPRQGFAVGARPSVSKPPGGPTENVPEIALSRSGQSNVPAVFADHVPALASDDKSANARSERAERCASSASAAANGRNRPAAMPAPAASRIALRRISSSASRLRPASDPRVSPHYPRIGGSVLSDRILRA